MFQFGGCGISDQRTHETLLRSRRLYVATLSAVAILLSLIVERGTSQVPLGESQVRYLTFDDVRDTLAKYADSGLPGTTVNNPHEWDIWVREQDRDVRSRIDRGAEDSISNLILYGTSFTKLPRLANSDEVLK